MLADWKSVLEVFFLIFAGIVQLRHHRNVWHPSNLRLPHVALLIHRTWRNLVTNCGHCCANLSGI